MGGRISRLAKKFFPKNQVRIVMVGLDASGKTSILYKLKLGDVVTTIPTIVLFCLILKFEPFHNAGPAKWSVNIFTDSGPVEDFDFLFFFFLPSFLFLFVFFNFSSITGCVLSKC
ncbi:hypothetical protein F8388_007987 [Cannabis sativa]|uniref:ADP-ribosylation factor n=1 Tax=Cannabis sativa TaxID=3483 RepID=A0A7J6FTL7_CANSA|nr:hypothetical protein F8388_007987 [Cannabis sativa]